MGVLLARVAFPWEHKPGAVVIHKESVLCSSLFAHPVDYHSIYGRRTKLACLDLLSLVGSGLLGEVPSLSGLQFSSLLRRHPLGIYIRCQHY